MCLGEVCIMVFCRSRFKKADGGSFSGEVLPLRRMGRPVVRQKKNIKVRELDPKGNIL